jgi:protoporphyrinogen oxidase
LGAISEQLKSQLKHTEIKFNTKVKAVGDNYILTENDEKIPTHFTIIATEAAQLVSNLNNQHQKWKSCDNLYFEVEKRGLSKPLIGLVADKNALVNNIFYHNSVETTQSGPKELLSVTVVKDHQLSNNELIDKVVSELQQFCGVEQPKFLKMYHINQALPDLEDLYYDISPTETQLKPTIYLAGDHLLNGSLNAAMTSGERAAQGVIMSLEDGLVVENLTSEYI